MGLADLVPGVSGGTIALLFGIYDELLQSIKIVTGTALKLVLQKRFKEAWQAIPFHFLVPLFIGIASAIFGLVKVVEYLLATYPVYVWSFFFGLILSSAVTIGKRVDRWNTTNVIALIVGALSVYFIIGLPATNAEATTLTMLITGAIAICAMILPGISGSLIMLILGQYENVINAVSEFKIQLLAAFAVGATIGLALFSQLLSWLLDTYHAATMAVLVGLMVGALRAVWPWRNKLETGQYVSYFPEFNLELIVVLLLIVAGYYLVLQLEKIGLAREHEDL